MMRIAWILLPAAWIAPPEDPQAAGEGPQANLERLRRLAPQEIVELRRRLEMFKSLPGEEQQRLRENLSRLKGMAPDQVRKVKERAQRLSEQERKEYADLAAGFFRWAHRNGLIEGFPRGHFFSWLKKERPQKMDEIRRMEPDAARIEVLARLAAEFRETVQRRLLEHVRRHQCAGPEFLETLTGLPPREFWWRYQEIQRTCFPPAAPRPPERPRK